MKTKLDLLSARDMRLFGIYILVMIAITAWGIITVVHANQRADIIMQNVENNPNVN